MATHSTITFHNIPPPFLCFYDYNYIIIKCQALSCKRAALEDINRFLGDTDGADNPEVVDLSAGAPVVDRLRAYL